MTSLAPHTNWLAQEMPLCKYTQNGFSSLTDRELLETIIGTKEGAKSLLEHYGNVANLARAELEELEQFLGISRYAAFLLLSCLELGRRKVCTEETNYKVRGSESVARYFQQKYGDCQQEIFVAVYLNRNHEIIAELELFKGGIASTIVDPKIVFRKALNFLAASIIVVHNHPSGSFIASEADKSITKKLAEASKLMDIAFLDHLIVSHKGYFSFADQGLL